MTLKDGSFRAGVLVGEDESVREWDASKVERKLDTDEVSMEELASILGVVRDPKDEWPHEIVIRALDAARCD